MIGLKELTLHTVGPNVKMNIVIVVFRIHLNLTKQHLPEILYSFYRPDRP